MKLGENLNRQIEKANKNRGQTQENIAVKTVPCLVLYLGYQGFVPVELLVTQCNRSSYEAAGHLWETVFGNNNISCTPAQESPSTMISGKHRRF